MNCNIYHKPAIIIAILHGEGVRYDKRTSRPLEDRHASCQVSTSALPRTEVLHGETDIDLHKSHMLSTDCIFAPVLPLSQFWKARHKENSTT